MMRTYLLLHPPAPCPPGFAAPTVLRRHLHLRLLRCSLPHLSLLQCHTRTCVCQGTCMRWNMHAQGTAYTHTHTHTRQVVCVCRKCLLEGSSCRVSESTLLSREYGQGHMSRAASWRLERLRSREGSLSQAFFTLSVRFPHQPRSCVVSNMTVCTMVVILLR